jgi:hypothetical protein
MMNNDILQLALKARVFGADGIKYERSPIALLSASALQYLVLAYIEDKSNETIKQKILEHLNNLTTPGNEPAFGLATNWCYPMLVNSIALIRKQPLWDELNIETQNKLHCLMKCFAYILHYACDKDNAYETSLRRDSHWSKAWAPNSRINFLCYAPILADYFGGREAFADLFVNFDYDAFIAGLEECKFTRALETFTTPEVETDFGFTIPSAREILEGAREDQYYYNPNALSNSILYGGTGKGIKREFLYSKRLLIPASDNNIIKRAFGLVYNKVCKSKVVFDDIEAGIVDNTISPYEGQFGMIFELDENWRGGRSCINKATIDFAITTSCLSAARALGLFDLSDSLFDDLRDRIHAGNNDLIYKLEHGYNSLNDGHIITVYERPFAGYFFWKDIWQNDLQK